MPAACPVCRSTEYETLLDEVSVRQETALRSRFVSERLERMPTAAERKDLTDFAHNSPASILCCRGCGLLIRDEREDATETYVEDTYDFVTIDEMRPRYVDAFRAKGTPYRTLLAEGARVLEIGPHVGAFLEVASEWGWQPEGVDIGKDTSAYLMAKGYRIHDRPIEQCGFEPASYDAVFIWNCFDQIEDAQTTLCECRRITKPGGVLVLRTPNGRFYSVCEQFLRSADSATLADTVVAALGYENLLAFPYLFGYDSKTLDRIARGNGFDLVQAIDSDLIILPFPEIPSWMVAERRSIETAMRTIQPVRDAESAGYRIGPWIELTFRACG